MKRLSISIIAICLLSVSSISCTQNEVGPDNKALNKAPEQDVVQQEFGDKKIVAIPKAASLSEIQELIGLGCKTDNQCKVIGVGVSPCGGHSKYLVYSSVDTDVKELKSKVAVLNGLQKLKNNKEGLVGICRHISPPKTSCTANQCVASLTGTTELK